MSGRNLAYGRVLQIIQNEEYLRATDLDVIRRYKRSQNEIDRSIIINDMLDFNSTFSMDTIAKTGLAGILFGLLYLNSKNDQNEITNHVIPSRPTRRPKSRPKKPEKLKKLGIQPDFLF